MERLKIREVIKAEISFVTAKNHANYGTPGGKKEKEEMVRAFGRF